MEKILKFRCSQSDYDLILNIAKYMGFDSVSEFLRAVIIPYCVRISFNK